MKEYNYWIFVESNFIVNIVLNKNVYFFKNWIDMRGNVFFIDISLFEIFLIDFLY